MLYGSGQQHWRACLQKSASPCISPPLQWLPNVTSLSLLCFISRNHQCTYPVPTISISSRPHVCFQLYFPPLPRRNLFHSFTAHECRPYSGSSNFFYLGTMPTWPPALITFQTTDSAVDFYLGRLLPWLSTPSPSVLTLPPPCSGLQQHPQLNDLYATLYHL